MMRSIFSSRRQSTIEKPTDLPLPPKEPQPEAETDVTQIKEKKDQMPRMEVFAAKLEETCKTMLAKFDSVTTWSLSVCTVRGFISSLLLFFSINWKCFISDLWKESKTSICSDILQSGRDSNK